MSHRPPTLARRLTALLCAAALLAAPAGWAQSPNALPALGDPVSEDLSLGAERQIGEQIMREIRRDPDYIDDPVLLEYLFSLWQPLLDAAHARGEIGVEMDLRYPFEPFLVRDRSVNAFALPGGFVGVHLGLIAMTATRDELAAVLAHELSHITQRHIARSIAPSRQASILSLVTTILGILAASRAANPDAANAANAMIVGGQAAAIQTQLNFSRDMEREADRVGYGVMTQAGYSAAGMASMFEKLDQANRINDAGGFPYLRSHPLTVERIGEARSRQSLADATNAGLNPLLHATAQARARVLMDPRNAPLRRLQGTEGAGAATAAAGPAEQLAAAYASALASTLLLDWARADAALAQARKLADAGAEPAARRVVRLLEAQSLLERGDAVRAAAALAPLAGEATRPVLLLRAQTALALAAKSADGATAALQASADALQTWVATRPMDASAWKALGQLWAPLGQPLRALRADAEAQLAIGDFNGAVERLRAAQRLARTAGSNADFIEASVVDSRLRAIEAQRRALLAAEGRKRGEPQ